MLCLGYCALKVHPHAAGAKGGNQNMAVQKGSQYQNSPNRGKLCMFRVGRQRKWHTSNIDYVYPSALPSCLHTFRSGLVPPKAIRRQVFRLHRITLNDCDFSLIFRAFYCPVLREGFSTIIVQIGCSVISKLEWTAPWRAGSRHRPEFLRQSSGLPCWVSLPGTCRFAGIFLV